MNYQFTDVCFITNDVLRLREFYEAVFGVKAEGDEWHSTMKIGSLHSDFYYEYADGASNTILSFNVDDTDT